MKIELPYGQGSIKFSIPDTKVLGILDNAAPARGNAKKLLLKSLRQKTFPFRKKKAVIVVPDSTRHAYLKEILPILTEKLASPGRSIDIIIATGLHKKHTPEQVLKLLGGSIVKKYKVLHHDPSEAGVADLGTTKYGVPVTLDKALLNYDLIVSVGIVEPHLYAGYSGGAKTIAIGLAGADTINATHSIQFLDDPVTNVGSLKGNKFQETLWHCIEKLPPIFAVNIVSDQDGKALKIFCGPVKEVFEKSAAFAKKVFEVEASGSCDIAICGVGYPKDVNLYQASRAMNYVLSIGKPVVKKGGVVIIAAELKDGIGQSMAEKRFYDELKNMPAPSEFIAHIRKDNCIAGEHRAYMAAKAMVDHKIMFVNLSPKSYMEGLPFKFFNSIENALQAAEEITGSDSKIYIIPHALATIARTKAIFA